MGRQIETLMRGLHLWLHPLPCAPGPPPTRLSWALGEDESTAGLPQAPSLLTGTPTSTLRNNSGCIPLACGPSCSHCP